MVWPGLPSWWGSSATPGGGSSAMPDLKVQSAQHEIWQVQKIPAMVEWMESLQRPLPSWFDCFYRMFSIILLSLNGFLHWICWLLMELTDPCALTKKWFALPVQRMLKMPSAQRRFPAWGHATVIAPMILWPVRLNMCVFLTISSCWGCFVGWLIFCIMVIWDISLVDYYFLGMGFNML